MSDLELDYNSDQEVSKEHSKLLESVSKLDKGQRVKKPERSEPTLEVSEFHLVKSGVTDKNAVRIDDLLKTLRGKKQHNAINKKLIKTKQLVEVLSKPLEKPAAEKLKREVGYENTRKEFNKWDAIVTKNRTSESLVFPLNQPSLRMQTTDQFVKRFSVQSDLEKKLATLEPEKKETEEKVDEFKMTLAEIQEKRKETAKFRVQQSYKAAKAMRQNKIKSKKFHRIQRKAKIKQELKEFEQLKKTDPEAALEKIQELDRSRAHERMSLRHKNSGQWAKSKLVRAKYDKDSRKELAQQLSIGRELTQKIKKVDSDEDEEENEIYAKVAEADKDNPYFRINPEIKTEAEIIDFVSKFRKFSDQKTLKDEKKKQESALENSFPVPAIIPESMNPVEAVIEEEEAAVKKSLIKNSNKKRESLDKIENKEIKVPKTKKKVVPKVEKKKNVGTSEWSVQDLENEIPISNKKAQKSMNIDEMFDNMEVQHQKRINKKMKKVKQKLQREVKYGGDDKAKKENDSDQEVPDLSFKRTKLRPELDEAMDETSGIMKVQASSNNELQIENGNLLNGSEVSKKTVKKKSAEIDPTKFINAKPRHLKTLLPDDVTGGDEGLDDSDNEDNVINDQHNIISEAFADDDVIDEFEKEKQNEIKKSQPENINLFLPGWGSWTGQNIQEPKRKRKRFILKFPKEAPRRDENKGDVIIIEGGNPKIRDHQVSDLPYPFESVADFEASIRAPIGRDFVPENAHKRLIRPAVNTKLGHVIEPMTEESLLEKDFKMKGKIGDSQQAKEKLKRNSKNTSGPAKKFKKNTKIIKK